jgi:hypothetical protein
MNQIDIQQAQMLIAQQEKEQALRRNTEMQELQITIED